MSTARAIVENATPEQRDQLCVNTIRTLSMDAVQQANSGHPGTPMALAPLVYTIWNRVLRFDPENPIWPNRDRFVLSNGHASMLRRGAGGRHRENSPSTLSSWVRRSRRRRSPPCWPSRRTMPSRSHPGHSSGPRCSVSISRPLWV